MFLETQLSVQLVGYRRQAPITKIQAVNKKKLFYQSDFTTFKLNYIAFFYQMKQHKHE